MRQTSDAATYWPKRALELLFVTNPLATSMGILLGGTLYGVSQIFRPYINTLHDVNATAITWWWCECSGVAAANVVGILYMFLTGALRPLSSEFAEVARRLEDGLTKRHITKQERLSLYERFVDEAARTIRLTNSARRDVDRLLRFRQPTDSP